jgi:molecular chaperone Hsp33
MAEVEDNGDVRGMVSSPQIEIPRSEQTQLGVGKAIGNGVLRVWREETRLSYESQVGIKSGCIGVAVAHYLEQSEQTRSAVLLGLLAKTEGITAAGGMMIEALPGPEDETLSRLEKHIGQLPSVSRLMATEGIDGLIDEVLRPAAYTVGETRDVRYRCRCSASSIRRFLRDLNASERDKLRSGKGDLEAECVFCGRQYQFDDSRSSNDEASQSI